MAKVWITEYKRLALDARGQAIPCPELPAAVTTVVDITAGSALMAQALRGDTRLIALTGDVAFHFRSTPFANPIAATVNNIRVPGNYILFVGVTPGNPDTLAISAIVAA